jgi:hypothetical protein
MTLFMIINSLTILVYLAQGEMIQPNYEFIIIVCFLTILYWSISKLSSMTDAWFKNVQSAIEHDLNTSLEKTRIESLRLTNLILDRLTTNLIIAADEEVDFYEDELDMDFYLLYLVSVPYRIPVLNNNRDKSRKKFSKLFK